MSTTKITTKALLKGGSTLTIQSYPGSSIMAILYHNSSSNKKDYTYTFNKFPLIYLKKYGYLNEFTSDSRYDTNEYKRNLKISITETGVSIFETALSSKNPTPNILDITSPMLIHNVCNALLAHIANMSMSPATYNETLNQLQAAGFNSFISELICFLISINPEYETIECAVKENSFESFMSLLVKNGILSPERFKVKAFIISAIERNSEVTKICKALSSENIINLDDMIKFGVNNLHKINGISKNYENLINDSIKVFINYCK